MTRIEDAVINTPSHRVHAHTSFDVSFLVHDKQQKVRLSLEPNHDLFSGDATIQYLSADGTVRRIEPIDRAGHRVFKGDSFVQREGESEWRHVGWTRINVRRDGDKPIFDGVFTINGDHHHVQTKTNYRQTTVNGDPDVDDTEDEYMVIFRDSDIQATSRDELKRDLEHGSTCGSDKLVYNRDANNIVYRALAEAGQDTTPWQVSPRSLFGRQLDTPGGNGAGVNLANSIGSTAGCPTTRKVALIGIATDCSYTAALKSEDAVTTNVISLVNAASQLYESTFNISLAIQNLTISEAACPSTPPASAPWNTPCTAEGVDITKRLSLFSQWRGQWTDTNAFWTLLSTCNTGNAVGLAWLGAVCQQGSSTRNDETSASANVVVRTSTEWLVFAHETGHTFGAVHDCLDDTCSNGSVEKQECCPLTSSTCNAGAQFIMNPSTGTGITNFSPCSIGNICSFLGRKQVSCLSSNRGVVTYTGAQCGNGIVEKGEDCDCGGTDGCAGNTCCDPATCKYTQGSRCDPANEECCTTQCGFMGNGTVCRTSSGPCDPQEVCPGTSAGCPADKSSPDGDSCGTGLTCASGRCTSRDLQCKTFLAGTNVGSDGISSCSSSGCDLSCASSKLGPQQCYVLQQWFLDGTQCEGGGKCYNGNCQGASLTQQIAAWINDNKQIFYPVVCVVGGLLLIAIISCCWSCFSRRRRRRAAPPRHHHSAAVPPQPRPRPSQRGWSQQYFGAGGNGGGGGGGPPMRPGPAYAPVPNPPPQEEGVRWQEPTRNGSYRYA